jgi:hypothetical protein
MKSHPTNDEDHLGLTVRGRCRPALRRGDLHAMVRAWVNDGGRTVLARVSWPGLSGVAKDGGAEPLAGQQGQLDRQSVLADGMAEGLLGLADPVLDTVLV